MAMTYFGAALPMDNFVEISRVAVNFTHPFHRMFHVEHKARVFHVEHYKESLAGILPSKRREIRFWHLRFMFHVEHYDQAVRKERTRLLRLGGIGTG
jgi:hypothetical protein